MATVFRTRLIPALVVLAVAAAILLGVTFGRPAARQDDIPGRGGPEYLVP